jgi:hypothetical protein
MILVKISNRISLRPFTPLLIGTLLLMVIFCVSSCDNPEGINFGKDSEFETITALSLHESDTITIPSAFSISGVPPAYVCISREGVTYLYNEIPPTMDGTISAYDRNGTKLAVSEVITDIEYCAMDTIGTTEYLSVFTSGLEGSNNVYYRTLYELSGSTLKVVSGSKVSLLKSTLDTSVSDLFVTETEGSMSSCAGRNPETFVIMTRSGSIRVLNTTLTSCTYSKEIDLTLLDPALSVWENLSETVFSKYSYLLDDPEGGYTVIGATHSGSISIFVRLSKDFVFVSLVRDKYFASCDGATYDDKGNLYYIRGDIYCQLVCCDRGMNIISVTDYSRENAFPGNFPFALASGEGKVFVTSVFNSYSSDSGIDLRIREFSGK